MRWDRSRVRRSILGVLVLGASVLASFAGAWAADHSPAADLSPAAVLSQAPVLAERPHISTKSDLSAAAAFSLSADLYRGTYRYQGAENYEGYGPIEEQLDVNNPPVPHIIGSRLLRENIPGVSEEMQKWPAFFRDLVLNLHFRSYYFNRDIPRRPAPPGGPDTFNQEAWALGGWLGLQSGWLLDTFRLGAVGYTSLPAYAPADRDGTGLLAPGQGRIAVIGQLQIPGLRAFHRGRFLVNQGFVNPQDNRMIPNTFAGGSVTGVVGPVEYYLGYLTAMKQRNSDTFIEMARAAGVTTGENRGMVITTLNF